MDYEKIKIEIQGHDEIADLGENLENSNENEKDIKNNVNGGNDM